MFGMIIFFGIFYYVVLDFVTSYNCGSTSVLQSTKIVGGMTTDSRYFPWFITIIEVNETTKEYSVHCAGTLITPKHSLTGAHCYHPSELSHIPMEKRYPVFINTHNVCRPEPDGKKVDLLSIELHQGWMSSSELPQNDIALMTFKYSIPNTPACLPSKKLYDWDPAVIIGFGSQLVKGKYPCTLKKAHITIFPQQKCRHSPISDIIAPHTMCAGVDEGGVDACDGDSGGPLMIVSGGRYEVVGIISYGKGCARKYHPGIYTDLSDPVHYEWIMKRIHIPYPSLVNVIPSNVNQIAVSQSNLEGSSSYSVVFT